MKTLHSIIARWTLKDKRKFGKSAEPESNESKDKEDKGYCLDKGDNLLSRTCQGRKGRSRRGTRTGMTTDDAITTKGTIA